MKVVLLDYRNSTAATLNPSRSATLVLTVLIGASCGEAKQPPRAAPNTTIITAEAHRTGTDAYRLSWTVEPSGAKVTIFSSTNPSHFLRAAPIANSNETETIITGLHPRQRHYFELVPEGGEGYVIATRFVNLEGAQNFRDLGGYETLDGRHVQWGTVFRSDALSNLTDTDLTLFSNMGIRVVCDLRRDSERDDGPDRLPTHNPPTALNLDIAGTTDAGASSLFSWTAEEAEAQMSGRYAKWIRETGSLYGTMIRELSDPTNRVFLFHCQGGKDRAGTGAALLLLALGVPEETIIADYLLTNEAYERTAVEVDSLAANLGVSVEVMKVLMYAYPSFIRAALDEIIKMSGSVDTYLREQMGLTLETRDRLRAELLY